MWIHSLIPVRLKPVCSTASGAPGLWQWRGLWPSDSKVPCTPQERQAVACPEGRVPAALHKSCVHSKSLCSPNNSNVWLLTVLGMRSGRIATAAVVVISLWHVMMTIYVYTLVLLFAKRFSTGTYFSSVQTNSSQCQQELDTPILGEVSPSFNRRTVQISHRPYRPVLESSFSSDKRNFETKCFLIVIKKLLCNICKEGLSNALQNYPQMYHTVHKH